MSATTVLIHDVRGRPHAVYPLKTHLGRRHFTNDNEAESKMNMWVRQET